ncbi:hypothetical protein N9M41_04685 [Rhodopirellula sp.]|nr:hypothetical protein [Rhodopirellula sp.]
MTERRLTESASSTPYAGVLTNVQGLRVDPYLNAIDKPRLVAEWNWFGKMRIDTRHASILLCQPALS